MTSPMIDQQLQAAIDAIDLDDLRQRYLDQDEFVFLERFLPETLLARWQEELEALRAHTHRNFIPGHKKGGSVGHDVVQRVAPTIRDVYASPVFLRFLARLVDAPIQLCPAEDLHACALYCYTEAGDHIGYHYDTSYYRDRRYTVLIAVRDESTSLLECKLRTKRAGGPVVETAVQTVPGSLVVFDGDRLLHRVTPLGENEERFIVTMQYVTDPAMNPALRFVSNMKDAIAYFGFRRVLAATFGRILPGRPSAT